MLKLAFLLLFLIKLSVSGTVPTLDDCLTLFESTQRDDKSESYINNCKNILS